MQSMDRQSSTRRWLGIAMAMAAAEGEAAALGEPVPVSAESAVVESEEARAKRRKAAPSDAPGKTTKSSTVVESRGYGARAETEPPRYVRRGSETGAPSLHGLDWLFVGADFRVRYEHRHHDYRYKTASDDPVLLRTRVYLGVEKLLDPLRLGLEFQDARLEHSEVADNTRDTDHADLLQGYLEYYGRDWLGADEPLRLQVGRLAFEYLDRRLISRNPWRNTTNNFEGFRLIGGSHKGVFWADALALRPVTIKPREADSVDQDRWFYGGLASYSGGSAVATLQPYWLRLDEKRSDRTIDTLGLRSYAVFSSGWDYDTDFAVQTGHVGALDHQAGAAQIEVGYTNARRAWKPRLSGSIGYASGDNSPTDDQSNRFNRLFGFGRPWSANDYHIWENLLTPKARIELKPSASVQLEASYGAFWLASDSDSWSTADRRDRNGRSGAFIGQELEGRVRWRVDPRVDVTSGYAHFFPGGFTRKTGPSPDSDFFYLELSVQAFK